MSSSKPLGTGSGSGVGLSFVKALVNSRRAQRIKNGCSRNDLARAFPLETLTVTGSVSYLLLGALWIGSLFSA